MGMCMPLQLILPRMKKKQFTFRLASMTKEFIKGILFYPRTKENEIKFGYDVSQLWRRKFPNTDGAGKFYKDS